MDATTLIAVAERLETYADDIDACISRFRPRGHELIRQQARRDEQRSLAAEFREVAAGK